MTKKNYFNAVIKHQHPTWQAQFDYATEYFSKRYRWEYHLYPRTTWRKLAKAYTLCYNYFNIRGIENVFPCDVMDIVSEYFSYKRLKHTEEDIKEVAYLVYTDLIPDTDLQIEEM